jgi:signal transduction histidine kinase
LNWFQLQTDTIAALTLLTCLLLIAFVLIRNNGGKKRINALLQQQKEKTESTLEELAAAKTQLEYKNRDLEIEEALEKVRSRSLAMHKSDELKEVIVIVLKELQELHVTMVNRSAIIIELEEGSKDFIQWVASPQHASPLRLRTPYFDSAIFSDFWEAKEKGINFYTRSYSVDEKNSFFNYFFEHTSQTIPDEEKKWILSCKHYDVSVAIEKNSATIIANHSGELVSEEGNEILKRFARVFELAYVRFLDLQRAEMQAREAQIETALEKVRSRSLAMHHSNELEQVVVSLFDRLVELGLSFDGALIYLFEKEKRNIQHWIATTHLSVPLRIELPYNKEIENNAVIKDLWHAVEKGEHILNRSYSGKPKNDYFRYVIKCNESKIPEPVKQFLIERENWTACFAAEKNSITAIDSWSGHLASEEDFQILIRFARVFEQAYIRFLDLQKAEAQARESQIQLALERVRARTMAMQKSDELADAATVLFEQFDSLGSEPERFSIVTVNEKENVFEVWTTQHGGSRMDKLYKLSIDEPHVTQKLYAAWKAQTKSIIIDLQGNELEEYFQFLKNAGVPVEREIFGNGRVQNAATFSKGILNIITAQPRPREMIDILERFAGVFDLTYTRFLDLQKAEAQAKEAQIEAALEKVRSRSLAMHHSDELEQVVASLFDRLVELGLSFDGAVIFLFEKEKQNIQLWIASTRLSAPLKIELPYDKEIENNAMIKDIWHAIENGEHIFNRSYSGTTKNDYFRYVAKYNQSKFPESITQFQIESDSYTACFAAEKNSIVGFDSWSGRLTSDEDFKILIRFARVFEQSYTRFLDLQKAEVQTREAQIEAALEKVRSSTMAMHKSEDLAKTAAVLFTQLNELGNIPDRISIGIIREAAGVADMWLTDQSGNEIETRFTLNLDEKTTAQKLVKGWKAGLKSMIVDLTGEELDTWLKYVRQIGLIVHDEHFKNRRVHNVAFFSHGWLNISALEPLPAETMKVLERFAAVYSLTYRRFIDLQKAEASAKEAVKQTSLDRIRADIASMRTTRDLDRITPLIWYELKIIDVPFVRCGVFIMDDNAQQLHTFLSTPDGKAIAAFHLPYGTSGNFIDIVDHWRHKKIYIDHWDKKEFESLADILVRQTVVATREQYLNTLPEEGIYLHLLPFLQGMLYVGNIKRLNNDEIKLLQSVADAFSTAYARYEDFNKLEAAKQQVEKTLVDLKQAQQQLVQSEKMASLGELTAGVAHEIQNPLNFVNNFSELNKELLAEMKDEIDKGNIEDAKAIADDVIENQEKINLHGKRADSIVKGMLQHSRAGSGQKELTDINKLADEYLRLSYHGMRAKDKSFNAVPMEMGIKTDFDESIEKINVVPQDIGRVLLNLYNNAFYAVMARSKNPRLPETSKADAERNPYVPTVTMVTKKSGDKILISVKDNGNGIPQNIVDKIFQPFFTTKPTGQGTGLGLSLAYDIIKAHSGEIKVETKEGQGSEFMIWLPV